jgi:hypothetical protein
MNTPPFRTRQTQKPEPNPLWVAVFRRAFDLLDEIDRLNQQVSLTADVTETAETSIHRDVNKPTNNESRAAANHETPSRDASDTDAVSEKAFDHSQTAKEAM